LPTYRSTSSVSSPNELRASRRAPAMASESSFSSRTTRMPLPPPPADGLSSTGKPTSTAASATSSSDIPGSVRPGTTGTPAAMTVRLARILSPMASMASTGGPMNTMPAAAQARANSTFSDRKP
jgi:hypothetical protein